MGAGAVVGKSSALSAELRRRVPLVLSEQVDKTAVSRTESLGVFVSVHAVLRGIQFSTAHGRPGAIILPAFRVSPDSGMADTQPHVEAYPGFHHLVTSL